MNHTFSSDRTCPGGPRLGAQARQRERGAAVFVVMMGILILSAIGMWAMHSATMVSRASGFARASLQTQYMAEMGVLATTGYLSLNGMAAENYRVGQRGDACYSVNSGFCKSIYLSEVQAKTQEISTTNLVDDTNAEGSFGPFASETQGDFRLEMTSPTPVYVAGNGIGGVSDPVYRKVVLTSFGLTRPHAGAIVSGNLCTVGGSSASPENSSAGRVGMRAHAIIGPLQ